MTAPITTVEQRWVGVYLSAAKESVAIKTELRGGVSGDRERARKPAAEAPSPYLQSFDAELLSCLTSI